jgi:RNA polymerase sigma-70 factor (ECF subfamily)
VDKDDDQLLVAASRAGDKAAFANLVRRYFRPVYNAAYRVLGNEDDAADAAQSVFLKVHEKLDDYDPRFRFFSWLYRIAMNESIDMLRRNVKQEPLQDDVEYPADERDGPEARMLAEQVSRRIQAALMRMKADDRVVIALRHFSECSYREIGEILELDEKTVKSRLFEARSRMRTMLRDLKDTVT